jgi:hypothetical protein
MDADLLLIFCFIAAITAVTGAIITGVVTKIAERIATDPEARRGAELASEIEQLRLEMENAQ